VSGDGMRAMLLNNNQVALIFQANSGLPFNIRSNVDLNADGNLDDRPLNIERNSGRLGNVINFDLRYSRFVTVWGETRGEVFVEAKNLFNRQNVSGVNRVVQTDSAGNPLAPIPNPFQGNAGYDQRIVQAGLKVTF